jgi:hypothetical protein
MQEMCCLVKEKELEMITEQAEIKFWNWLKSKLSKSKVDMQRIENTTGGGVPDVNMCHRGTDAWLELKVYVKGNVVLRKQQYAWIVRRAKANGNVMVVAWDADNKQVDVFMPGFSVRPWGNTQKYVAITSDPDFMFQKNVDPEYICKVIFSHK